MKRFKLLLFLLFVFTFSVQAQKKAKSYNEADIANMVFSNEWSFGIKMHTNGFGANFERVWIKSIWKRNVLQTNFFYFKDFKEKRTKSPYAQVFNAQGYFYGKQNNFWNINLLYGQKKVLGEKAEKNGVRVSFFYLGGVTLGILKPYGLAIVEQENFSEVPPVTDVYYYDEDNPAPFLDPFNANTRIYGAAGLRYGFNKIKPIPGIHAKFGFNFDWAGNEYIVKSIEIGAQLDVYYKKLPIMISDRNKPYILNLYLAFQLGKRW